MRIAMASAVAVAAALLLLSCGTDDKADDKADGPWTELADPGPALTPLAVPLESGVDQIERACIKLDEDGVQLIEVGSELETALDVLGVATYSDLGPEPIPKSGCDATFVISASASRSAADYQLGRCWTGWRASGRTTLLVDGTVQETWTDRAGEPTSGMVEASKCADEDDLVAGGHLGKLVTAPLLDLYGTVGLLAHAYTSDPSAQRVVLREGALRSPFLADRAASGEFVRLLISRLAREPDRPVPFSDEFRGASVGPDQPPADRAWRDPYYVWSELDSWLGSVPDRDETLDSYRPLIPYLIALLDCDEEPCSSDSYAVVTRESTVTDALEILQEHFGTTDETPTTPEDWWQWWERLR